MKRGISSIPVILLAFLLLISCNKEEFLIDENDSNDDPSTPLEYVTLPKRPGPRPETTTGIPHIQIDVELVPEVHEEMIRRIFSVPGIEEEPSVIAQWRGMWLKEDVDVAQPEALIEGREFGHIHDDGSLHIFLDSRRAIQAVDAGWAVFHPFAVQELRGWEGFVMLYTPQSIEELDVTFQLIVDAFNYVSGQTLSATDFYE
jgi:phospholipase/carboxylesterase